MNLNKKIIFIILIIFTSTIYFGCTQKSENKSFLQIVLKDSVKTLDPTASYDAISSEVLDQIYESPLQYDYKSETPKLIPNLASEMPIISKDGLSVTLKIKKGVRFQDDPCFVNYNGKGREVIVDDIIYALKRLADPSTESQGFWILDNKVKGINEFQKKLVEAKNPIQRKKIFNEVVDGLEKKDDHTLVIKLIKPYPQILYTMAMHFFAPIPYEAVDYYGKDFVKYPVGTGPYKLKSYEPNSKIVLVKNENYLLRNENYEGKTLPRNEGIVFHVVKEDQPRWLGFLNGDYDQIEVPKDNFNSALVKQSDGKFEVTEKLKAQGIYASFESSYSYWYVSFNMKDSVIGKNKYLRQAIASAIDAKKWLEVFKNGRGSIQTEMNPPNIKDRCGKNNYPWTFSLERAKELLKKAGYPNGANLPALQWDTRGAEVSERQIAEFVQKSLAEIGIKLEINVNTFSAFLDKMNKGNLQISKGGWLMDYPDAENSYALLYGPNKAPGPNDSNFENSTYDKLFEKMSILPVGSSERKKIICELEKIIQEEVPIFYVMYEDIVRLVRPSLKNYQTRELVINKYKYIEKAK